MGKRGTCRVKEILPVYRRREDYGRADEQRHHNVLQPVGGKGGRSVKRGRGREGGREGEREREKERGGEGGGEERAASLAESIFWVCFTFGAVLAFGS